MLYAAAVGKPSCCPTSVFRVCLYEVIGVFLDTSQEFTPLNAFVLSRITVLVSGERASACLVRTKSSSPSPMSFWLAPGDSSMGGPVSCFLGRCGSTLR